MRIPKFRITIGLLMIAVAITAVFLVIPRTLAHRREVRERAEARYVAAVQSYAQAEALFINARIEIYDVHLVSRMLLEAQRDIGNSAAAMDHLKRMQKVRSLEWSKKVFAPSHAVSAADLFVKEAELWVAKEMW